MRDDRKTKKELVEELASLREEVTRLTHLKERRTTAVKPRKDRSEHYRTAVELSNDPALIIGNGRRLFFNQNMLQMLGYDAAEEIAGKKLLFSVHPDDLGKVREWNKRRKEGKDVPSRYEIRVIRKDNTVIHVESSVSLIRYEGKQAFLVYCRDITERKRAEEALIKSEKNYRSVIENIQDGYFRSDSEGRVLMGSPSGVKMFGYDSHDEIVGLHLDGLWLNPDERNEFLAELREKKIAKDFDAVFKRKDGTLINASLSAQFYYDENGRILGTEGIARDITKRKQAESLYRTLAERSLAGVYVIQDGKFRYLNAIAASYSGCKVDELTGRTWSSVVHPQDWDKVRKNAVSMLLGKSETPYEFRIITKAGEVRWMIEKVARIEYEGSSAILGNCMDITEAKRIQDTLRNSEQEMSHILGAISELVFYLDTDMKIISVNPAAARFFKRSPDQVKGKHCYEVLHGRTKPCPICPVPKVLQTGKPQIVLDFPSYGRWWILYGHPVWSDGKIIGVVEIVTDITERKLAEDALRESEEKYRLLVDNAGDAIVIVQDSAIRFANPMVSKISGCRMEELIDKPFTDFIHPDDRTRVMEIHRRTLQGEKGMGYYEFRGLAKAGEEHWAEANAVVLTWQGRPATLVFLRDITKQKTLEVQLLQSQKLEALGTLAGGVAHDFNNLLSGILGHTSLLEMDDETTKRQKGRLEGIKELVKSASSLTNQLLGFARMGRYEVKTLDINEILEKTSNMFGRTRKEVMVHKKFSDDPMHVEVDRTQWEQVFMNLFVNAWQAMPGGGSLYIETSNVTFLEDDPKRTYKKPGNYVKISVTDTGVGMDDATKDRIFEPFFTTKEMGRGTGLGLAMVYGIVKGHNGYIDVHSAKGHGTTFDIHLPASERQLIPEREEMGWFLAKGSGTVLLIDDEDQILEIMGEVLKTLGYTVLTARNGLEAIDIYRKEKSGIDLVILDLIMPGMSGSETFERLRELNGDVKVILSSGYSLGGQAGEVMEKGCRAFIQKPFSVAKLSKKVQEVLEKK